jgi:hypothetical protein
VPILINNKQIETRLEEAAKAAMPPASKRAMARAILARASSMTQRDLSDWLRGVSAHQEIPETEA